MDCRVAQRCCFHGRKSKYKGRYYVISRKKETHEKKTFQKRTRPKKAHQQTSFSLEFPYSPRCSLKYQPFRGFFYLWLAAFEHHHRLRAQCDNAICTRWFPRRKLLGYQKALSQCAQALMHLTDCRSYAIIGICFSTACYIITRTKLLMLRFNQQLIWE